ncbi:polysaccharide export protein [Phytohalomonas tamaricis]|uniref:polysaccharide export protein n=1 Tax=Phytohalomonas tamaricis TaxID=2081032 RepID=UPI000D0AC86B|nr:polysaccharide export protein [Phytohalomonas tamaricis]
MKRLLSCALMGSALALGGCVLAPGGDIDYDTSAPPIDDLVDVEPITFGLVQSQSHTRTTAVQNSELKQTSIALAQNLASYEYHIGKGDILSIIVYDHPELTIPAGSERSTVESGNVVHNDGTIFYPYIGRVQVLGKTVREVRAILTRALGDFVAEPQVEVNVASFQSQKVYVTGQVQNPGLQPITNVPMTLIDAVTQAGGMTQNADWHHVVLTRNGKEHIISIYDLLQNGQLGINQLMQNGDVLHVPDIGKQKVYVMGMVRQPGGIPMGGYAYSLTDALSQAGGINEDTADASGIFVIRKSLNKDKLATVYQLNAANAVAFVLGTEFELEPQDIIYVTAEPISRWNRVISQLLPSTNLTRQAIGTSNDYNDL